MQYARQTLACRVFSRRMAELRRPHPGPQITFVNQLKSPGHQPAGYFSRRMAELRRSGWSAAASGGGCITPSSIASMQSSYAGAAL